MREDLNLSPQREESRGEGMRTPDDVSAMIRLKALGWGSRRIAAELGCGRETVRRWLETGRWRGYRRPGRPKKLDGLETWLQEKFRQHRGNADVVRQDLQREHGIVISLRTLERSVAHLRQELLVEARATVRFETPPGKQLQIDFGELLFADWWRIWPPVLVCRHTWLFAANLRAGLPARAASGVARWNGGSVPPFWRRYGRNRIRQRPGFG